MAHLLADRSFDLATLRAAGTGRSLAVTGMIFDRAGGAACGGLWRVIQNWTAEFQTEPGSCVHEPDRGCPFMALVAAGGVQTEADVFTAFAASAALVASRLRGAEAVGAPADERLSGATLEQVSVRQGAIDLVVRLRTKAGQTARLFLPVEDLPAGE